MYAICPTEYRILGYARGSEFTRWQLVENKPDSCHIENDGEVSFGRVYQYQNEDGSYKTAEWDFWQQPAREVKNIFPFLVKYAFNPEPTFVMLGFAGIMKNKENN